MRYKALTLVVAVLLAIGTSGAVATSMTTGPSADATPSSSADVAQPANHTVDIVDPDDELTAREVDDAWHLAWADEDVRSRVDDAESLSFKVWAPVGDDDHISVWIEEAESPTQVITVDVDLETDSVVDITEPEVHTADEVKHFDLEAVSLESQTDEDSGLEFEVSDENDDDVIRLAGSDHDETRNGTEFTVIDAGESQDYSNN